MPCCGLPSDYLYQRLKAAAEEGSEAARQLLEDFMEVDEDADRAGEEIVNNTKIQPKEGGADGR